MARGSQQAAQTRFEPIRRDNHRVWARYQGRRLSACARLVQGFKVIAKQHTRTQIVRVFGPIPWDWPQELGAVAMVKPENGIDRPAGRIAAFDVLGQLCERLAAKILASGNRRDLAHTALQFTAHQHQIEELIAEAELLLFRKNVNRQQLDDASVVCSEGGHSLDLAVAQLIHVGDSLGVDDAHNFAVHLDH